VGRKVWIWILAAVALLALLAWAWIDGGREPARMIEQPIPLPEGLE
jgi:hypothetical protein